MAKRLTNSEFIERAKEIHGDKYDYSKVEYKNSTTPVVVVCSEHGEFNAYPTTHIRKAGCPVCSGAKVDTKEFIKKAREVHGDKYDYSLVEYTNMHKEIELICSTHGVFKLRPANHIFSKNGCVKCVHDNLRYTKEIFINKAIDVHGDKYDYSKVSYESSLSVVKITCSKHGEFEQVPAEHLSGRGCYKCGRESAGNKMKKSLEDFIAEATEKYDGKYDYSKVVYTHNKAEVKIICPEHGEFLKTPNAHLRGGFCRECSDFNFRDTISFIEEAKVLHGDKYDYSKAVFTTLSNNVKIICSIHGEFEQRPSTHLKGAGCGRCSGTATITNDIFIERAKETHGDKYDYSLVDLTSKPLGDNKNSFKVKIICPEHGAFEQRYGSHLRGEGCFTCSREGYRITQEDYIKRVTEFHGGKYDYSNTIYTLSKNKITYVCPEHGEISQTARNHMIYGCRECKESQGERKTRIYLKDVKIKFEREKTFDDCRHKNLLPFDFYLPDFNICIEYDGRQHYELSEYYGGEKTLKEIQQRDQIKNSYCKENDIYLIRIPYWEYGNLEEFLEKELLKTKIPLHLELSI